MPYPLIGTRTRALRRARGLTQRELAQALGFNDRQTVSAIESGARRVTAEELLRLAETLDIPLESFTDPFQLADEAEFSCLCAADAAPERLVACEQRAEQWVAAFRTLAPEVGRPLRLVRWKLGLGRAARRRDAMLAGEQFAKEFKLGDTPALRLTEVMEKKLGMLVLAVDIKPSDGISGTACHLPDLDAALLARREPATRRCLTLARMLFHLLVWDTMPPKHRQTADRARPRGTAQLAGDFADAVLVPAAVLRRRDDWSKLSRPELIRQTHAAAEELHVTTDALRRRLVALGLLAKATARELPKPPPRRSGGRTESTELPALFSKPFMDVIGRAIDRGRISVRRTARLLELTIDDLADLLRAHGLPCPFDL